MPDLVACSPSDMLLAYHDEVAALVPGATVAELPRWEAQEFYEQVATVIARFLDVASQKPA